MNALTEAFTRKVCPYPIFYLIIFLTALHFALTIYINSSFLATVVDERYVGMVYTASSFLAIITVSFLPLLLRKLGNYRTLLIFLTLELVGLLGLAIFGQIGIVLPLFIVTQILSSVIVLNNDIFLEACSCDDITGNLRGTALTVGSIAFLIGPAIAGFILTDGDFWKVFVVAALIIIPIMILAKIYLYDFADPKYSRTPIFRSLPCIWGDNDLRNILFAQFILRIFYAWMVIYTPLYLYEHIGFDWTTIGIIFFIMILPFSLLQLPLGRIADQLLGEKEILTVGFIIAAIFTAWMSFSESINPAWWAFLLLGTRIGASAMESMIETYFFKHIGGSDTVTLSFYRNLRPIAYLIAPIIASVALFFIDLQYTFLLLAIIVASGVFFSLSITDTK